LFICSKIVILLETDNF